MKRALLLENIDRGSTYSFLRASDFYIQKKLLNSSVKNWESICDILDEDKENQTLVVAKFTEWTLGTFLEAEYQEVGKKLIERISHKNHIIFIYSDNYHGYFNFVDGYADPEDVKNQKIEFDPNLRTLIEEFNDANLNIVTYETLIDLEIASQGFIENIAQGLLLKFYIPNEKFGSIELDRFIILFKDFISTVSSKSIRIHQNRTSQGVTCTLYSESKDLSHDDVYNMFDDFTSFMELCVNDPEKASEILMNQNIPKDKASLLLSRHVKEAKRILLDLKQDKERRILQARQNLEMELLEEHIESSEINKVIELLAPEVQQIGDVIRESKVGTVNLNINPQIINKVEGVVAKEFHGNVNLSAEDEQLKMLIEKYSGSPAQKAELYSSIHEMNDPEIPTKDKKYAASKLKSFVIKYGEKIGDIGFSLLTKYLEGKMGLE